jgi:glycosyltransferase involved in cell wall biosynthesis
MPELPPLPPVATQPLSVVLLAHDDAPHLEAVVAGWVTYLNGLGRDYEVLLVDDGSSDGTAALLDVLASRHGRVQVWRHADPRGEGAALRTALAAARHPLLFYTPCKPEYRPADLQRLLTKRRSPKEKLEIDQAHILSGYRAGVPVPRFWRGVGLLWRVLCRVVFAYAPPRLPGWLGWRGHAGRLLARALFCVPYHDIACPFRLLRREIFARIPLQSDGPFVHVEILAKATFLGHVLSEELPLAVRPAPWDARPGGGWRQVLAEGYRLFNRPDFGPPVPAEAPAPAEAGPPVNA